MWLYSALDHRRSGSHRRRAPRPRTRGPRRQPAGHKPTLERLEDRSLLSVGPLPIPGGHPIPNPFGGPDVHHQFPGPADATGPVGGEPSLITDFNGFIGVARVQGTGTDNRGNTLLWDADLRFMDGVYRGVDGDIHHGTFAFV
jgi:hypothetical protein